jgi:nitrogen regulatory protein PII-like uncharacterized protein
MKWTVEDFMSPLFMTSRDREVMQHCVDIVNRASMGVTVTKEEMIKALEDAWNHRLDVHYFIQEKFR